jgi:UTP--glucose-1-phosphate uridylyltransferase
VSKKVTKAVIAAAGFGTRFLPQTKAMPKEMLPLVDKPIIQYIVEELVAAGIKDIIIVTGYSKRSIEDHFDAPNQDLIANLKQGGPKKAQLLKQLQEIGNMANFIYIRQKGPYGSATPIINAAHLLGNEPFIYTYADELVDAKPNRFKQMIKLYDDLNGMILPCIKVSKDEEFDRYGIMDGEFIRPDVMKLSRLVEKPGRKKAPSNLASVGGYLLTPEIFPYLEKAQGALADGDEFFLTTYAIDPMIRDGHPLYGCELKDSHYYDTGNKLEYLKTVVYFALQHEDLADDFRDYLKQLVSTL